MIDFIDFGNYSSISIDFHRFTSKISISSEQLIKAKTKTDYKQGTNDYWIPKAKKPGIYFFFILSKAHLASNQSQKTTEDTEEPQNEKKIYASTP